MRMPLLIFDESGTVEKYDTVTDAEGALEAIDVQQGIYQGYDADARRLEFFVVAESGGFRLIGPHVPRVSIRLAEGTEPAEEELAARIRQSLRRMGVDDPELSHMPLVTLIRSVPV